MGYALLEYCTHAGLWQCKAEVLTQIVLVWGTVLHVLMNTKFLTYYWIKYVNLSDSLIRNKFWFS